MRDASDEGVGRGRNLLHRLKEEQPAGAHSWLCTMNHEQFQDDDAAGDYQACVAREREAWDTMHQLPAGSEARTLAFLAWSEAISRTNQAWRRFNAGRVQPGRTAAQASHA